MRRSSKYYLAGLAALLLAAVPALARTDSSHFQIDQPTQIGQTQLQPGDYEIRADEGGNSLDILQNDHKVAEVPCHWVELTKKANDNQLATQNHKVTQIEFAGRTEAIQVSK
jgi:hypothetical protein